MVAGEASGDIIGAAIIQSLKCTFPEAKIVGVGGPEMAAAGCECWYNMSELSVMGITEVLRQLPRLLKFRSTLVERISSLKPTAFIGIDAPDFNLGLAERVKSAGIRTVHVVSPSVWAWRQGRIKQIEKAVDLMLPLFPFEEKFYARHQVRTQCIGHPLADEIALEPPQSQNELLKYLLDTNIHCAALESKTGINTTGLSDTDISEQSTPKVLTVLPGSRAGELKYLAPVFIQVMAQLSILMPNLVFLVPCVNKKRLEQFRSMLPLPGESPWVSSVVSFVGNSRLAMAASDAVLVASGTATLEAMLLKKPMVVAYRWHWLTHAIIAPLVKAPFVSLPNLLADQALVPEFIQQQCRPDMLLRALVPLLSESPADESHRKSILQHFEQLHKAIRLDAAHTAVQAIMQLCALQSEVQIRQPQSMGAVSRGACSPT